MADNLMRRSMVEPPGAVVPTAQTSHPAIHVSCSLTPIEADCQYRRSNDATHITL
jgi:hypothetical protein